MSAFGGYFLADSRGDRKKWIAGDRLSLFPTGFCLVNALLECYLYSRWQEAGFDKESAGGEARVR